MHLWAFVSSSHWSLQQKLLQHTLSFWYSAQYAVSTVHCAHSVFNGKWAAVWHQCAQVLQIYLGVHCTVFSGLSYSLHCAVQRCTGEVVQSCTGEVVRCAAGSVLLRLSYLQFALCVQCAVIAIGEVVLQSSSDSPSETLAD